MLCVPWMPGATNSMRRPSFDRIEAADPGSLFQILCSIRSERQLMEQMDHNLLFRWFVGLGIDDAVWGEGRPKVCPVDRFQP